MLLLPLLLGVRGIAAEPTPSYRAIPLAVPSIGHAGFTLLSPAETGLAFTNTLSDANAAENQIRLNGSGVALGDVDGDGKCDIFVCALEGHVALFKNLGGWRFTNVTAAAGLDFPGNFATGATFADVDGDGDLDLLINGIGAGTRLFLNDGRGHFTAAPDSGLVHAFGATTCTLADVAGHGALDLYVANYRTTTVRSTGFALWNVDGRRMIPPAERGHLELTPEGRVLENGEPHVYYHNDGHGHFRPVPWTDGTFLDEEGHPLTEPPRDWGLTAAFRDLNGDGRPDLYVCNDFQSPDRIWINDGHGHFRAIPRLAIRHTSTFSMAVDFADVDRDGRDDILVSDMMSRQHGRRLMQIASMEPYQIVIGAFDDRPQLDRTVLQWNRGDGTYADVAAYAGLDNCEWNWSVIFLDVDLDGYEDVLASTGHMFDTQDRDAQALIQARGPYPREMIPKKLLMLPPLNQAKLAFRNRGDLTFEECGSAWGFNQVGVSHGMALADLDNDGDLDVVVNNLNGALGVYRNDSSAPRVAVRLKGLPPNTHGIGARITVTGGPVPQSQELMCGGRYLSCDDTLRVFAAGSLRNRLRIEVAWRSGRHSVVTNVQPNYLYEIDEAGPATSKATTGRDEGQGVLNSEPTGNSAGPFPLTPILDSENGEQEPLTLALSPPRGEGMPTDALGHYPALAFPGGHPDSLGERENPRPISGQPERSRLAPKRPRALPLPAREGRAEGERVPPSLAGSGTSTNGEAADFKDGDRLSPTQSPIANRQSPIFEGGGSVQTTLPPHIQSGVVTAPGKAGDEPSPPRSPIANRQSPIFEDVSSLLGHVHHEEPFDDFWRQPLLPKRLSQLGPGVSWWDVDGDGWEDLVIGSGKGGQLAWYRNDGHGRFTKAAGAPWDAVVERDQTTILGFGTGMILAGSANYEEGPAQGAAVEIYGLGQGRVGEGVAAWGSSVGPLAVADYDGDGQLDLFVGGRVIAGRYPEGAQSRLYQQRGGRWELDEANSQRLAGVGMVSGAVWSDLDGDGWPELVLACEWGPIRVFHNEHGALREVTAELGLARYVGWWNGVTTGDLDGDGRLDIIASNWGLNTSHHASPKSPQILAYGDFNRDGRVGLVEAYRDGGTGRELPERDLDAMSAGLGFVRERFATHAAYGQATVPEILGEMMKSAHRLSANTLASMLFLNRTNRFEARLLPREAQFATAFAVCVGDFDGDGGEDVFLSQNFFATQPKLPRCDAGRGLWLRGDGHGGLEPVPGQVSGVEVYGEQRGAALCDYDHDGRVDLVVTQNGAATRLFHNVRGRPGLRVRLQGPPGNPQGIGAQVRLKFGDRLGPAREVRAGSGYWSQDGAVQVLGCPAEPTQVWVRWPGGKVTLTPVPKLAREVVVSPK